MKSSTGDLGAKPEKAEAKAKAKPVLKSPIEDLGAKPKKAEAKAKAKPALKSPTRDLGAKPEKAKAEAKAKAKAKVEHITKLTEPSKLSKQKDGGKPKTAVKKSAPTVAKKTAVKKVVNKKASVNSNTKKKKK